MTNGASQEDSWKQVEAALGRANSVYVAMHGISATYAQLAVRSALLLNGGALFAMPAFFAAIKGKDAVSSASSIMIKAGAFYVAGIVAAAICCLIAYIDYQMNAERERAEAQLEAEGVKEKYDAETFHRMKESRSKYKSDMEAFLQMMSRWNSRTSWAGIVTGLLSYVFFCWGSYIAGSGLVQN